MQKITEYKVVMGQSPSELVREVNALIRDGWVPTGGIAITQGPVSRPIGDYIANQTFSHQAMVKLEIY